MYIQGEGCGRSPCDTFTLRSRSDWGARSPSNHPNSLTTPIRKVVIHHTETYGCFSDLFCIPTVMSIQNYHISVGKLTYWFFFWLLSTCVSTHKNIYSNLRCAFGIKSDRIGEFLLLGHLLASTNQSWDQRMWRRLSDLADEVSFEGGQDLQTLSQPLMAHPYQRAIFDLQEFSKIQSHIVLN